MARKTQYVILGLLTEQPLSGYDIKKIIDIRFKFFWNESYGQIYPELKQLIEKKYIQTLSNETDRGKQLYQITELGFEHLKKWLEIKPDTETMRLEILLKRYFGGLVHPSIMISHIKEFQIQHEQELQILHMFKHELETIDDPYDNHSNVLSVIDLGIKTNNAYCEWASETINQLEVKLHEKNQNS